MELRELVNEKYSNYKVENGNIKSVLNFYKNENEKLKNELNKYIKEKIIIKNELNSYKKLKESFREIMNNKESNYKKLIDEINKLKDENTKLKNELLKEDKIKNNFNNENNDEKLDDINKMINVNIISVDQKINCSIKCVKKDIFVEVEEKLNKKFGELRETNNNFIINGKTVIRFKKICDNDIKDGDIINLIKIE